MNKKIDFKDWLKAWSKSKIHKPDCSDINTIAKQYDQDLEALNLIIEEYVDNELLSEKLNLNTKIINILRRNGIYRINQMKDTEEFWDELLWFRGMGKKSLESIKKEYKEYIFWRNAARGNIKL